MRKIINGKKISLGTCYYPEHWKRELWDSDLDRMLAAGIETVRIAEFAWNKFEPEEGRYDFSFFDEFLELAEQKGMQVIFCTPTATPPAWLTVKYPEVLNCDMEGHPYEHGARRHYNYNSPVYREFCARLVEKTAEHYGPHPAIIGWQLDNEFNCENDRFYSESDTKAFRIFLQKKYQTLDALNDAWGTVFWNQTYTAWDEVDIPKKTNGNSVNPHRALDYVRFISDSVLGFAKMQSDIIRKYCKPDDFITTNGFFGNMDNHLMNKESLDFYTYDSYPDFMYCLDGYRADDVLKDRRWSRNLAETRSVSKEFGIMEQQSGANGWNDRMEAPTPKPGQMTLWTMQSIAHGADFISYFRWRTCNFGTEMYWHGILDYSGRDNRRIAEVKQIHKKLEKMQEIAGSKYLAQVAVVKDYDNLWDAGIDRWHGRMEEVSQDALFTAFQLSHTPFDYLYLRDETGLGELTKYKVLFYPHAQILTEARTGLLEKYVEQGGILVLGCRTGQKDIHAKCVTEYLPGLARPLSGTDVPEYSFVHPEDAPVYMEWDGRTAEAAVFNDLLQTDAPEAKVLASYTNSYYPGTPALVYNPYGKGGVYYFGAAFALDTAFLFLEKLGIKEPWKEYISLPESCELAVRRGEDADYMFLLNFRPETVDITIKKEAYDMLSEESAKGEITLAGYEVKLLRFDRSKA